MASGIRVILLVASAAAMLFGQGGQPPGGNPGGGPTTGNPGNTTPPGSIPGQPGNNRPGRPGDTFPQDRFPQMDRQMPIFLSGKVTMEDGTPPPEPVAIERICNGGQPRVEHHTDSKGRFSFQLGNSMNVMQDASVGNSNDISDITGSGNRSAIGFPGQQRGFNERDLLGCELRASLPGYRSQVVSLAGRRALENPDVGTIILKRIGNVEGRAISITSLEAPKDAKKAYEKGKNALKKKKDDEAQRELQKAVELYPEYAAAWFELGGIHERAQNVEEARKAYAKSLESDSKFVYPYMQLAGIAAREQKWQEVDDTTDRVLKLNPYDFPAAYLYNAFANLNMQKLDEAEKSAREGLKQDEMHRVPKLEHLLAIVLAQKNDYSGAAEHFKAYLKFAPTAKDADTVRTQLAEIEKSTATAAPAETKP